VDLGLLGRATDAWNAGDFEVFIGSFSADAVVVSDPRFPAGGTFEGRDAIRGFFEDVQTDWQGGSRVDYHELREVGGRVFGAFTWSGRGKASGVDTSIDIAVLWTIRDGVIVRAEYFFERDEALKAAELPSQER